MFHVKQLQNEERVIIIKRAEKTVPPSVGQLTDPDPKEDAEEKDPKGGKEMGKVMGVASKELAGLAEGRAISAKVKELLG